MKINQVFLLSALLFTAVTQIRAQGLNCETSEPFCTGTIYTFPAGTTGTAQSGAHYGCLTTQPAPAWYHLLIDNPGNINIYMFSTPLVDIDFICWGPFSDPYSACVTGLTANKVVACSYSPNPTENCYIPNGQTGEYYILLITNFSQDPCNITFSQTWGTGSTDCTILPPPVNNNGPLCIGETLFLTASFVINATYSWTGPSGFMSTLQNPVIPNVTLANAGDYSCVITVNGQSSSPAVTTVVVNNLPSASLLTGDTIICHGTSAAVKFQLAGTGPFQIDYTDGFSFFTATNIWGPVGTVYVSPTSPATYTFSQVRDAHCSRDLLSASVNIGLYPYTSATIGGTASICAGDPAQLTFDLTGTPPWNIVFSADGSSPQTVLVYSSPHVMPVFPAGSTVYSLIEVTDFYCSGAVSGNAQISVYPKPVANAGNDQTLPHGAYTMLDGQAGEGSGDYSYAWSPPEKFINPYVAQPTTVNLTETTLFTFTVTDNLGGCQGTDEVIVTITGGPLGCNPYASLAVICHNQTSQLYAMPTGGSGDYTYSWHSMPAGFSSVLANPVVQPGHNTTYYVAVSDGFNVTSGSVSLTVNPRPVADAGHSVTIPHGTSTQLAGTGSGGSGSYLYFWEPPELLLDPYAALPITQNLFSTTLFSLTVTDQATGCASEFPDHVTVTVTGDALSVNPVADPNSICKGDATSLFALAGGGSGSYIYSWTSDPPGYASTEADPVVSPMQTGTYTVQINDGYNIISGSCLVTVLDAPVINLGPASILACVYDIITLDAGNEGSDYLWSNGSKDRKIEVASSGIGYDVQPYSVTVTNPNGCQATSSISIIFDFSICTGVEESTNSHLIRVFPNPGNGNMNVQFMTGITKTTIRISDLMGQTIWGPLLHNVRDNDSNLNIELVNRPDGIYFIHIIPDGLLPITHKYILSK